MFDDRRHAGQSLGKLAAKRLHDLSILVLALPRGGVPVGIELVRQLEVTAEFDVFLVRKLGMPGHQELAFGAIASGGVRVLNRPVIEEARLSSQEMEEVTERERIELQRREHAYRQGRSPISLQDRVVVLVDDGLATGATMIAAVRAARLQQPKRVVVAAPVASEQAAEELAAAADELICQEIRDPFHAVGYWYRDFSQVTDDEVRELLRGGNLSLGSAL